MTRHPKRTIALFGILALVGALAPSIPPESPPKNARELYDRARQRYDRIDSYVARLTRTEVVQGERRPEEVIQFKFREKPWSAYMKWVGDAGQGREGTYVKDRHDNKVHTRLAFGDVPFLPAGRRMALDPDGALLRAASPHPVTDLGLGAAIGRIGAVLAAQENGDEQFGTLRLIGPMQHRDFSVEVYGIEHDMPPGLEPALPKGGKRVYWFDPASGLPTVIQTRNPVGGEVEHYRYDRLQLGVGLDDADFDPDRLWGAEPKKS